MVQSSADGYFDPGTGGRHLAVESALGMQQENAVRCQTVDAFLRLPFGGFFLIRVQDSLPSHLLTSPLKLIQKPSPITE